MIAPNHQEVASPRVAHRQLTSARQAVARALLPHGQGRSRPAQVAAASAWGSAIWMTMVILWFLVRNLWP